MRIIVQLKPEATERHRSRRPRGGRNSLSWLDRALVPVHTGTSDPTLASFFEVEVGTSADAESLVKRLLDDPSVDAAYVKPDDEPPSM